MLIGILESPSSETYWSNFKENPQQFIIQIWDVIYAVTDESNHPEYMHWNLHESLEKSLVCIKEILKKQRKVKFFESTG